VAPNREEPKNGDAAELQRSVHQLTELLVDMIEFAHATRERKLEARYAAHALAVRHGLSLQELAEQVGISVDTVANLLEKEPVSLMSRLRMSEESVDALLELVAKRRQWVSGPGGYEERLHLDSVILRTLFTRAPIGFAVLDTDLRYVLVNEALAEINGLPVEAHIGRTLSEVVPDLAEGATEAFQRVLGSGEPLLDLELTGTVPSAPGQVHTWYESVYRITDNRGVLGVAVLVTRTRGGDAT
jgi:PAS domain S-box-containing protein